MIEKGRERGGGGGGGIEYGGPRVGVRVMCVCGKQPTTFRQERFRRRKRSLPQYQKQRVNTQSISQSILPSYPKTRLPTPDAEVSPQSETSQEINQSSKQCNDGARTSGGVSVVTNEFEPNRSE